MNTSGKRAPPSTTNEPKRVAELLRQEFLAEPDRFPPGSPLETYGAIAARLGVSVPTVHRAMVILAHEGMVELGGTGHGTRRAGGSPPPDPLVEIREALREEWRALPPGTDVPGRRQLGRRFGMSGHRIGQVEVQLIRDGVIVAAGPRAAPYTPFEDTTR